MIEIIPAIDLIGGRCVRLSQGDYARRKTYDQDPVDLARQYAGWGVRRLHLVDLDGAKASSPQNLRVLEQIASLGLLKLEWGGGIKTDQALSDVWNAGADWAIVGSVAAREPARMQAWLRRWGPRIILGADARDGRVAVNGWLEDSGIALEDLIGQFLPDGLEQAIVTDIARDGMLNGPSFPLYQRLKERFPALRIIVSGGVSRLADILEADRLGLDGIITGKALYENRITSEELKTCLQNGSSPASM
ncbi:MAG: 1-(5-phosphoribosyl)-5-[Bacteroidales bacterium]|nr:1-(5-phosphoribosyl)-5-[(5-phosphoribosylamino)methylideneamino]imidazole-4-carboxamide isomerase [Bacteroidales bacterium]